MDRNIVDGWYQVSAGGLEGDRQELRGLSPGICQNRIFLADIVTTNA